MNSAANSLASDAAVRRRDWQIILLIGVIHASSHFFQLVLPSLYVSLGNAFGLDFARLGLLVSTFMWCPASVRRLPDSWWTASARGRCCGSA